MHALGGDFFREPLPEAVVITMAMILHDWHLERKRQLVKAAYDALPEGGAYIVIENIIEVRDAFDFTGADLAGPTSAGIAYK